MVWALAYGYGYGLGVGLRLWSRLTLRVMV